MSKSKCLLFFILIAYYVLLLFVKNLGLLKTHKKTQICMS